MILWFLIFEFGLRTSAYELFLEPPARASKLVACERRRISACHWFRRTSDRRKSVTGGNQWQAEIRLRSQATKLANSSQNVRHFARGQNMQISTFDVITFIDYEGNKRRSGKFFVTGGPVSASCKTPLTWKALSCLYFRKAKSEEHTVSDLYR